MADYKEAYLATRPKTLDPAEYFNLSPDYRRTEEERAALRSRLKRHYLVQLNNPHRKELIEDPALTRWTYARTSNIYPNFRPTPKTSLLGGLFGVVPLFVLYFVFKTDRDKREDKIKAGNYERPYKLSS
ncbi:NADH dehydrogenase [ubiquinone] 1 beta subcomplex subunit 4-like isoform X2 [Myxocyprinus asiaticus]|uniref:NADH dehydrogenase [ubiquinone] 1 beta subcomplex subunit 4-like isoform X2 n=1 Tax=Myxocyprinus asiaticus TaxID=70543 RepID=UPI00222199DA|nr:NADH dehydrogenase [ubiquinone] 1 beta subcomplex subunit 4-like isoform X2 [Myxocyprinus asiaticus]